MPVFCPCAVCGEPMQIDRRTSLPAGQAKHRRCRAATAEHGSEGRYRRGCRCVECRGWKASEIRAYKRQRREAGRPIPKRSWLAVATRLAVYERDGWACQLCGDPVDRDAHWNDDMAPSLDHIVPTSQGGTDDPANLRTTHRWCNCIRGAALVADQEFVA